MTANTKKRTNFETGEEELVHTNFSLVFNNWWKIQNTLLDEYPMALKVFTWLIHSADKRNAVVVSYSLIAKTLNLNERTIYRAIAYLKENKYLTILKSGSMNIYVLNDQLVWKDTANTKDKYSSFSAKVYILASEQEAEYQTKLMGHVIEKVKKTPKKRQVNSSEAIKKFEEASLDFLPSNIKEFIKKGYVYVGETDNAYELNDKKGVLTIIPK